MISLILALKKYSCGECNTTVKIAAKGERNEREGALSFFEKACNNRNSEHWSG